MLLEALALGVPVVALAELGTREIVLPQRGARAAPDDPAGFATVVADLMRDPGASRPNGRSRACVRRGVGHAYGRPSAGRAVRVIAARRRDDGRRPRFACGPEPARTPARIVDSLVRRRGATGGVA